MTQPLDQALTAQILIRLLVSTCVALGGVFLLVVSSPTRDQWRRRGRELLVFLAWALFLLAVEAGLQYLLWGPSPR